uniref:Uncharacterized protein n=1 Tax=Oryza sativa subsp. japonica TaxID=39947 RepID=Q651E5_ORYSJ|nr:hypothetical protein [Oryza sativa Japonica Group]
MYSRLSPKDVVPPPPPVVRRVVRCLRAVHVAARKELNSHKRQRESPGEVRRGREEVRAGHAQDQGNRR